MRLWLYTFLKEACLDLKKKEKKKIQTRTLLTRQAKEKNSN